MAWAAFVLLPGSLSASWAVWGSFASPPGFRGGLWSLSGLSSCSLAFRGRGAFGLLLFVWGRSSLAFRAPFALSHSLGGVPPRFFPAGDGRGVSPESSAKMGLLPPPGTLW